MNETITPASEDYFDNHRQGSRWPFTIYHRPIERSLERFLARQSAKAHVVVFGCGLFHESSLFENVAKLTLLDVDERLRPKLQRFADRKNVDVYFPQSSQDLLEVVEAESVDAIVSKEVIEHLDDSNAYLRAFATLLKSKGNLWISTPNYGDPVLPLLERTALEVVARFQGFSRAHIHPNKYSAEGLRRELIANGFVDVNVKATPWRLALCAESTKP